MGHAECGLIAQPLPLLFLYLIILIVLLSSLIFLETITHPLLSSVCPFYIIRISLVSHFLSLTFVLHQARHSLLHRLVILNILFLLLLFISSDVFTLFLLSLLFIRILLLSNFLSFTTQLKS